MFRRIATAIAAAAAVVTMLGVGTAAAAPNVVLGGGSGITVGGTLDCTLTTIGNDNAGRLVGLTAGHCGGPGAGVQSEGNRGAGDVGHVVASNSKLDYAVIEFDRGKVVPVNHVGNVTITGIGAPAQFPDIACKEGRTTGNTCGVVWGDVFQSQETWTQLCVVQGDSGSPVVVGTTLVAMVNAYLAAPCVGPEVGTNINVILGDINAQGGVGAGFRPI